MAITFLIVYPYTQEYFPTKIRATGLGFLGSFARIGGILSPFIGTFEDNWSSKAPYINYLIMSSFAIFACYSLDVETKDIVLDDPSIYKKGKS